MRDEELCMVLEYIVGRGENLRLVTGKLRAALAAFFDSFGAAEYCRLCGYKMGDVTKDVIERYVEMQKTR